MGLYSEDSKACYLEVGVYQGLTLLSVADMYPGVACFGVDNFSILDPEGSNLKIVQDGIAAYQASNATLINLDFEVALKSLEKHTEGQKIAVYFVDGPHDYRSQLICLTLAVRYLHENAVILIDDANYHFVRQATHDFLDAFCEYKLIFEAYSPMHPANMGSVMLQKYESGWLNGINILVRDPENILPEMRPKIDSDYSLFLNDWLVHRHGIAELAPEALDFAQAICQFDEDNEKLLRESLLKKFFDNQNIYTDRPKDRVTRSSSLPKGRFSRN